MPVLPSPTAGRTACMTSVNVTDSLTRLPALTSSSPPRAVPFILWSSPSYSPSCSVHHRCRRCRLRCRRHFRRRPRYRRPHGLAHCVAASCLLYATFRPLRQPIRCPTVTVAVAIVVTAASIAILVSVAVSMCGPSSYMESTSVLTVIPGGRGTGRRSPELLLATPAPEPHECSEVRSLGEAWSFEYLSRYRLLVEGVGRCHLARVEGLSLPFPGPLLPCLVLLALHEPGSRLGALPPPTQAAYQRRGPGGMQQGDCLKRRCASTRVRRTGAEAQSAKVTMARVSGVHDGKVARGSL